jgi:Tfp pilus assembly protein PilF
MTNPKFYKVRYSYSETGSCLIQAKSKSSAENKLQKILENEGLEGLNNYTPKTQDREYDAFGAEQI